MTGFAKGKIFSVLKLTLILQWIFRSKREHIFTFVFQPGFHFWFNTVGLVSQPSLTLILTESDWQNHPTKPLEWSSPEWNNTTESGTILDYFSGESDAKHSALSRGNATVTRIYQKGRTYLILSDILNCGSFSSLSAQKTWEGTVEFLQMPTNRMNGVRQKTELNCYKALKTKLRADSRVSHYRE